MRRDERLTAEKARRFDAWIARRAAREPAQHIVGLVEFHGLVFRCDRRALVPRPETEGLLDAVLGLDGLAPRARVADLGTGAGSIAVTLAVRRPGLALHALDVSPAALELAAENARVHGVAQRVEIALGDLARPPRAWLGTMDVVVSNPPYVSESEWRTLEPEVRDHDPREALVAGPTGLEAYVALAPAARALLRAEGWLVLELGYGQADRVVAIVGDAGFSIVSIAGDLQGIPRVLIARSP